MVTHHENHECKVCEEESSTFMELLKHVAKHHSKEVVDNNEEEESKDQVKKDGINECIEEKEKVDKDKIFVFG